MLTLVAILGMLAQSPPATTGAIAISGGGGAITLVQHCSAASATHIATCTMTTTGANYLHVACFGYVSTWGAEPVASDSSVNTYTELPFTGDFSTGYTGSVGWFSQSATPGVAQVFTCTGNTGDVVSIIATAFSGVNATALDHNVPASNSNSGSVTTTIQPGSLTASGNGYLYMAILGFSNGPNTGTTPAISVNSGFTIVATVPWNQTPFQSGGSVAYLIQTTAAATNPTWTLTIATDATANMATFKH